MFFPSNIFRSLHHQSDAFEITEVADKPFHYVIVGGGVSHCTTYWNQLANLEPTAGHTLAARPTEDPLVSVFVVIYVVFYLIYKILNTAPYVLRRGMYACVHRWAVYVRPRGV